MPFAGFYVYKFISGSTDIPALPAGSLHPQWPATSPSHWLQPAPASCSDCSPYSIQSPEGVPLYMPYGLNVALPAMLLEHIPPGFSILEALVTGLIFAYIQRTDTSSMLNPGYARAAAGGKGCVQSVGR